MGKVEDPAPDVPEDAIPPTVGEQAMRQDAILTRTLAAPSTLVADIEAKTAELIDICEGLQQNDPRLSAIAKTYYEIGGMLARRAATS